MTERSGVQSSNTDLPDSRAGAPDPCAQTPPKHVPYLLTLPPDPGGPCQWSLSTVPSHPLRSSRTFAHAMGRSSVQPAEVARQRRRARGQESLSWPHPTPSPGGLMLHTSLRATLPDILHFISLCHWDPGAWPLGCTRSGPALQSGAATEEPSPWLRTGCGSGRKCGTSG